MKKLYLSKTFLQWDGRGMHPSTSPLDPPLFSVECWQNYDYRVVLKSFFTAVLRTVVIKLRGKASPPLFLQGSNFYVRK